MKSNWYKTSQAFNKKVQEQNEFPFFSSSSLSEEILPQHAPQYNDHNHEFLEKILTTTQPHGIENIEKILSKYRFEFKTIQFHNPQNTIIRVELDNNDATLITDMHDPDIYLEDPETWVIQMSDMELYSYIPPVDFTQNFWENLQPGFSVFHATQPENLENIQKEGLLPKNITRGINNKYTGSSVFTSNNTDDISSYGNLIFEINLYQMKQDGYTPEVSMEGPIEEAETREKLAHMIGIPNPQYKSEYYSEGLYDTTLIFYDPIPPKYLTII